MARELAVTPGIVLRAEEQSEDKSGWRTIRTYSGTKVECIAQRTLERTQGAKTIMLRSSGDGNYELVVTYPYDADNGGNGDGEIPTDTHELDVSMAQQDVFTNPKFKAAIPDDEDREKLIDFIHRYKSREFKDRADALEALDELTVGDAAALAYFKMIAFAGVDSWILYRGEYTRIISLATPRQVKTSFAGKNKMWTVAQVLAQEKPPTDWYFDLNEVHPFWHKSIPTVKTDIGRDRKTQIQYQYIGADEQNELLYDNYAP